MSRFGPKPKTWAARFWPKVDKSGSPHGCWLWLGARGGGGYGRFSVSRGVSRQAHRIAWQLCVGPIGDELDLDHWRLNAESARHTCARHCVNPEHLQPKPRGDNLRDSERFRCSTSDPTRKRRKYDLPPGLTYTNKHRRTIAAQIYAGGRKVHLGARTPDTAEHRAELAALYQAARPR